MRTPVKTAFPRSAMSLAILAIGVFLEAVTGAATLRGASGKLPVISYLTPASVAAGGPSFTLTVNGSNFNGKTAVLCNGSPRATTVVNSTQVQAVILGSDIASPGTDQVSVATSTTNSGRPTLSTTSTALLTVTPGSTLAITTTSLPNGTVGVAYSATLSATGGNPPYTWSIGSALPFGLTLNTSGAISGTPTASGSYTFTVQVIDSAGHSASQSYTVSIASPLSITTASLPNGTVGTVYSATLSASGGTSPDTWSVTAGQLPSGVMLSSSGTLSGTPTTTGSYSFTVQAADSAGRQASQSFGVSIAPASSITITSTSLPNGIVGKAYSATLSATGGTPPYTWSVTAGQLPTGVTLSSSGTLSGTPTTTGSYNFTVRVADSAGVTQSAALSVTVTNSPGGVNGSAGATSTQYVLTYTAANSNQCTIEVSENPSYTPLVHAIDPALFAGANLDGQTTVGTRAFVVGQKWIAQENVSPPSVTTGASACSRAGTNLVTCAVTNTFTVGDNIAVTGMGNSAYNDAWSRVLPGSTGSVVKYEVLTSGTDTSGSGTLTRADRYSLALQANTTYYYRLGGASNTCGASPASGQFTTMTIPNGNTWNEGSIADANGVQLTPTVFEDRTTTYVDALTGALTSRWSLYSDINKYAVGWQSGAYRVCSLTTTNGFYHCLMDLPQGDKGLYSIDGSTGETHWLGQNTYTFVDANGVHYIGTIGQSSNIDTTDPNRIYWIAPTHDGQKPYKEVLGYVEFNGNDATDAATLGSASFSTAPRGGNFFPLTPDPSGTLGDLMTAFISDPTYSYAHFPYCTVEEAAGDYLTGNCNSGEQGAAVWYWVYQISASKIVASGPSYELPNQRWCGSHGSGTAGSATWMEFTASYMQGNGVPSYQVAIIGAMGTSDTSTTVTGAFDGTTGEPQNVIAGTTVDINGSPWYYLQNTAGSTDGIGGRFNGDLFQFQDTGHEIIRLVTKGSCTATNCTWSKITRGLYGTSAVSHAANTTLRAMCEGAEEYPSRDIYYWKFASDPHLQDTTNTYVVQENNGPGHGWGREPYLQDNESIYRGTTPFQASTFTGAPTFTIATRLPFAGHYTDSPGTDAQNYATWDFENASFKDASVNIRFWLGGSIYGVWSKVGATSYIYQRSDFGNDDIPLTPVLPYISMQGLTRMKDISAPGAALSDTTADNLKVCVVRQAGECWPGSTVGQVYANLTNSYTSPNMVCGAGGGENAPTTGPDWCVVNPAMYANALSNYGLIAGNTIGTGSSGEPLVDAAKSRRLVETMAGGWRLQAAHPHTVPDGSYLMFESAVADPHINVNGGPDLSQNPYGVQVWKALIPPQPTADGIDRTNFEAVPITIGAGSGGATQARLKWGYLENEPRFAIDSIAFPPTVHFYCQQYQGACYWNGSASSPSFSSGTFTALTLNSTANLEIGVPQRVIFYQVEYLNGSNQEVATDPMQIVAIP